MKETLTASMLVVMSAVLLTGCERTTKADGSTDPTGAMVPSEPATSATEDPGKPELRTATAAAGERFIRTLRFRSHLMVDRNVGVTTRRDGIIESIAVQRGQRVKEDQELAAIEDDDLVLSEKTAVLELEQAQASYERSLQLFEQEILSSAEFERIRLDRDSAEKVLEKIRYELEKCVIKAPFDGVISGRFVEKGQVVREDDRRALFQVTALGPLLARIYVPEEVLFALRPQQEARVIPTAAPVGGNDDEGVGHIEGRIKWINHVVDAASGTVEVLVEILPGPHTRFLRPGLSVDIRIGLAFGGDDSGGAAVSVPREVLSHEDPVPGLPMELEVLSDDGSVQTRSVVLGFVGDDRVEIRRGLSAGEKIVMK